MIYNLEKSLSQDVIENGVYESLTPPSKGIGLAAYTELISEELENCPYLHCPDYNLLVPIYNELAVIDDEGNEHNIYIVISKIIYRWWNDGN